ncbi:(Fe-S)-binding protein [Flavilitoribacter nigricans]|uniref:Fe-S oxidoreductase n=1 Tax=Flavilitoribacter nigricans (strain ATCC 23147 / DSM 23189 / NBRC 102662 / NCIMB 1420 / SS-2) TaxID=1122177 RepID=A0A2D0N5Z8_FLAN2|nr:(Fe-S)-binding protein [Flavilitoribacter nigricans]PHN03924.1 Fe-S oxidoreductase [Flavilitoribacter nigricans DSM 23189 = NBRC 102662]
MKVGLFVPCYVDQFYPQAAIATLELLEKLGVDVEYPKQQTCCGQPMANSGYENAGWDVARRFVQNFKSFDYIVTPSGSCALHVKENYDILGVNDEVDRVRKRTYELCEFLTDVLKVEKLDASFPHKVGLHKSCHGLRGLRMAKTSELMVDDFSKLQYLLGLVQDIELVELARTDECCGFGGTFAVSEVAVSVKMGKDRIKDHESHGAEYITSADMSCLMHMEGLIRREKRPLQVVHIAEILNGKR